MSDVHSPGLLFPPFVLSASAHVMEGQVRLGSWRSITSLSTILLLSRTSEGESILVGPQDLSEDDSILTRPQDLFRIPSPSNFIVFFKAAILDVITLQLVNTRTKIFDVDKKG